MLFAVFPLFGNMKVKTLIVLAALSLIAFSLKAQEGQSINEPPESTHREVIQDEGKILNDDHATQAVNIRDSIQAVPRVNPVQHNRAAKPDAQKSNRKENQEEDALSFNFLYYMIQKFKLSDLIDQ